MTLNPSDEYMHGPQPAPGSFPISPSILTLHHFSEASRSHEGTPASTVGQLLETRPTWEIEQQTHNAEMSVQLIPHDVTGAEVSLSPCNSSTVVGDANPQDVPICSLIPLQEQATTGKFCRIQAKPSCHPPVVTETTEPSVGIQSATKKTGKRQRPLEPEVREGAHNVRKLRACAHCRTKKIRVS